jgi:hypothetical protein
MWQVEGAHMKWPKTKQTANAGVLYVETVVNNHGSIFRRVHQEEDVGIDGFIELVHDESASGKLIAVQIKSGDSYLSEAGDCFEVAVNEKHLSYWRNFMLPVILVCYSPTKDVAAWISLRDFIEQEEYLGRVPITKVNIPLRNIFDQKSLLQGITTLAHIRSDEGILIKCAEKCLSSDPVERYEGFLILSQHPVSRGLKMACLFANRLLMDSNVETAKLALHILGYGVARNRWSFNPGNSVEADVIYYASSLASGLSNEEIRRIVELVDDEYFSGPDGLGERCFDVLCCCFERADSVLYDIAADSQQPMKRRANALYLLYECEDDELRELGERLRPDPRLGDVYRWMFETN